MFAIIINTYYLVIIKVIMIVNIMMLIIFIVILLLLLCSFSPLCALQFTSFFTDKIKSLHANLPLNDVNPFPFPDQPATVFSSLEPVTTAEIRNLILSSQKSICLSDSVPSKLLHIVLMSLFLLLHVLLICRLVRVYIQMILNQHLLNHSKKNYARFE